MVTRGRGRGNIMKVVKRYHLAVITKISTRNVRYNMVNIINSAVCYIRRLSRVNLVLITGENIFFISLVLYLFLTFAQRNIKLEISLWFCISLRLFATPWGGSLPGSSVHGILPARILE